ncbi:hypothetical protein WJX73_003794 [Symbiochloris irregularis]|uniref:USP domain-containing protein n=1 Tax=Symbiochloris irregularis TaxID=706552 RepID=A0AAW1P3L3_9CHLO
MAAQAPAGLKNAGNTWRLTKGRQEDAGDFLGLLLEELRKDPVVQLHLQRDALQGEELQICISIQIKVEQHLNLSPATAEGEAAQATYRLLTIVQHHGPSLKEGHYTSLHLEGGQWWKMDDDKPAAPKSWNQVKELTETYICVYVRTDPPAPTAAQPGAQQQPMDDHVGNAAAVKGAGAGKRERVDTPRGAGPNPLSLARPDPPRVTPSKPSAAKKGRSPPEAAGTQVDESAGVPAAAVKAAPTHASAAAAAAAAAVPRQALPAANVGQPATASFRPAPAGRQTYAAAAAAALPVYRRRLSSKPIRDTTAPAPRQPGDTGAAAAPGRHFGRLGHAQPPPDYRHTNVFDLLRGEPESPPTGDAPPGPSSGEKRTRPQTPRALGEEPTPADAADGKGAPPSPSRAPKAKKGHIPDTAEPPPVAERGRGRTRGGSRGRGRARNPPRRGRSASRAALDPKPTIAGTGVAAAGRGRGRGKAGRGRSASRGRGKTPVPGRGRRHHSSNTEGQGGSGREAHAAKRSPSRAPSSSEDDLDNTANPEAAAAPTTATTSGKDGPSARRSTRQRQPVQPPAGMVPSSTLSPGPSDSAPDDESSSPAPSDQDGSHGDESSDAEGCINDDSEEEGEAPDSSQEDELSDHGLPQDERVAASQAPARCQAMPNQGTAQRTSAAQPPRAQVSQASLAAQQARKANKEADIQKDVNRFIACMRAGKKWRGPRPSKDCNPEAWWGGQNQCKGKRKQHVSTKQRRRCQEAAIAKSGIPLPLNMVDRPWRDLSNRYKMTPPQYEAHKAKEKARRNKNLEKRFERPHWTCGKCGQTKPAGQISHVDANGDDHTCTKCRNEISKAKAAQVGEKQLRLDALQRRPTCARCGASPKDVPFSFDASRGNFYHLCRRCHKIKEQSDVGTVAKRLRANHKRRGVHCAECAHVIEELIQENCHYCDTDTQAGTFLNHVDRVCSDHGEKYCACGDPSNMVTACSGCNYIKGAQPAPQFVHQCGAVDAAPGPPPDPKEDTSRAAVQITYRVNPKLPYREKANLAACCQPDNIGMRAGGQGKYRAHCSRVWDNCLAKGRSAGQAEG